ncbi:hypothetical protein MT418_005340 [Batrachochytrium dendrobatidis]
MDVTRILHGMDKVHSTTNCANPKDFQDKCELLKLFARWLIDDSDSAVGHALHSSLPNLCTTFFGASGGLQRHVV